jgi:HEAT repeat protein
MRRLIFFCAAVLHGADQETLMRQVAAYEYGKDAAAVRELETLTLRSGGSIEKLLLTGLDSAKTLAAKDAFCRNLAVAGGDAAVAKLAPMLMQADTAEMARYALERIPSASAGARLREAASRTSPPVQTGIVVSLGRRKDAAAAALIKPLLASKDTRLADAAATALGEIATPAAREALLAAQATPAISAALLGMADAAVYQRLYAPAQSEAVRAAALEGLARVEGRQSAPLLHAALKSDSVRLQATAIRALVRIEGAALAKELPNVPERARVEMISALADTGQPAVRQVLLDAAANESEAVRVAALNGLAKLGTAPDVPMLASRAGNASGDEQAAARFALGALRGQGIEAAILQAIPGAEPKVKVELIRAVGERGASEAAEVLLSAASDADRLVRIESVRALRETASFKHAPALLALLAKAPNETERRDLERTVAGAIRRSKEGTAADVVEAYKNASRADLRISLLSVMSLAGHASALPTVRQALQDASPDIQRAALNALSGWPSHEPMEDLLTLARSSPDPARRILALRGYFRLVQLPSGRTLGETAKLLQTAMSLATRAEEKRPVLAVAQRLVCPESLELAKTALKDPQVAAEAQIAVTTLERALSFVK